MNSHRKSHYGRWEIYICEVWFYRNCVQQQLAKLHHTKCDIDWLKHFTLDGMSGSNNMWPLNTCSIQTCTSKTLLFFFSVQQECKEYQDPLKDFIFNSCWALASQIKAMFVSMLFSITIHVKSSIPSWGHVSSIKETW